MLPSGGGRYRLEGFGADGEREFSVDFELDEVDHGGGSFLVAIPFDEEWLGSSASCSPAQRARPS